MHWNWVCGVVATKVLRVKTRPDEGVNAVYGVAIFIGILTVMLASVIVAILTIKRRRHDAAAGRTARSRTGRPVRPGVSTYRRRRLRRC